MYLKTLSNAGLDCCVPKLEEVIRNIDQSYSTPIRSEAIIALRKVKKRMPQTVCKISPYVALIFEQRASVQVRKILMPIYMNRQEPTETRIEAVYQVLQTLPERAVLEQIAYQLNHERNAQVSSFVYTYMMAVANSTNPCMKKL